MKLILQSPNIGINLNYLFKILKEQYGIKKKYALSEIGVSASSESNWRKSDKISIKNLRLLLNYFNQKLNIDLNEEIFLKYNIKEYLESRRNFVVKEISEKYMPKMPQQFLVSPNLYIWINNKGDIIETKGPPMPFIGEIRTGKNIIHTLPKEISGMLDIAIKYISKHKSPILIESETTINNNRYIFESHLIYISDKKILCIIKDTTKEKLATSIFNEMDVETLQSYKKLPAEIKSVLQAFINHIVKLLD